eukprot:TRINITY_DN3235_c0_g4_i1.p1 TRINITY_DN3235_c0_g4~~TRINITY_DN3235_c0_g4_i1.p1  ORF type:complete len:875 (-),score=150.30 TRINITY_DN3235_c0_g4_i1:76-2700(-)
MSLRSALDGFFRPKVRLSLENLQYLTNYLLRNMIVSDTNCALIVENIRTITDIIVWGDQNDQTVVDYFLEKAIMNIFIDILKLNPPKPVKVQILHTTITLLEKVESEMCVYFLLSNNRANDVIQYKFDLNDEEILVLYTTLLRNTSAKLNENSVQFFYDPDREYSFPLYLEAVRLFNHPEGMVRIAVRNLTLNVFRVDDSDMRAFLIHPKAALYFLNLSWLLRNLHLRMDKSIILEIQSATGRYRDLFAELVDVVYYLNDVMCCHIPGLNETITDYLLQYFFLPMLVTSLVQGNGNQSPFSSPMSSPPSSPSFRSQRTPVAPSSSPSHSSAPMTPSMMGMKIESATTKSKLSTIISLASLTQFFSISQASDVLNMVTMTILFKQSPMIQIDPPPTFCSSSFHHPRVDARNIFPHQEELSSNFFISESNQYRTSLLLMLNSPDERIVHAALLLLYGIATNPHIHPQVLKVCGIYPMRLRLEDTPETPSANIDKVSPNPIQAESLSSVGEDFCGVNMRRIGSTDSFVHTTSHNQSSYDSASELLRQSSMDYEPIRSGLGKFSKLSISISSLGQQSADTSPTHSVHEEPLEDYSAYIAKVSGRDPLEFIGLTPKVISTYKPKDEGDYSRDIVSRLLAVYSTSKSTSILLAVEALLKELLFLGPSSCVKLIDQHLQIIQQVYECSLDLIQTYYAGEMKTVLPELFEEEYRQLRPFSYAAVSAMPSTYSVCPDSKITVQDLSKKLTISSDAVRKAIQVFLIQRRVRLAAFNKAEDIFPFPGAVSQFKEGDITTFVDRDVIGCTIMTADKKKMVRYIVTDQTHMMMVEPDLAKMGYAVVKWVYPYDHILCHVDPNDASILQMKCYTVNPILFSYAPETSK